MAQPGIDPNIQKAQTYLREMGFHARVRDDAGVLKRTPVEVTGVDDSLTQRSLRKFRAENGLPPDADLQTTIAKMEQEDVKNKYRESLGRQGFQYPYTGQTITAAVPATGAAAPAQAPAAAPQTAATAAQKTEAASYLMMMGYDVTEGETRTAVSDVKLTQAIDSFRQSNQIPATATPEEILPRLRAGLAADPMSVEIMMGVSNSETPTALEAGALQYGLQAHGFNVPVTGQEDAATKAAMTQLVDRHQAQLDSGAIVQTATGYAKPGAPQTAAPEATVEQAQAYLKILGYNDVGPVDNIRGPLTDAALSRFARDNQMDENASLNDLTAALKTKVISDPNVMVRAETIVQSDNPSRSEALAAQYAINAVYGSIPNGAQLATDGIVGPQTESFLNHIKANPTIFAQGTAAALVAPVTPVAAATTPADGTAAPVIPVEVTPLPPVATVTAPDSAAPASAAVAAAPATGAAAATVDAAANRRTEPVPAPDRYEIGRGGTLSPYQRDVAGMRGGPDFDAARPPPLEDLRAERQREAEQRRENAENNRAIQQGTRGLEQLTNARGTDDIRGISSIAQAVLGLSR